MPILIHIFMRGRAYRIGCKDKQRKKQGIFLYGEFWDPFQIPVIIFNGHNSFEYVLEVQVHYKEGVWEGLSHVMFHLVVFGAIV